jgi:GAF domain-containing protein
MSREGLLVQTLVELADNLVDDFDVIDVLTVLSDRCVTVLDVDTAGVMLASPAGDLQVVASSSDTMRSLELFELQTNEGPCVDCFQSGAPIVNVELAGAGVRWPRFAPRAVADGFHSVHALPMHLRGTTVGALNLFRIAHGSLGIDDVLVAQALADVATIAIIQHQAYVDAAVLNAQLGEALNSRIVIEQAKGRISEASGRDVDESFRRLRNHARSHNLRLTDLARQVVDGTVAVIRLDPLPRTPAAGPISSDPRPEDATS